MSLNDDLFGMMAGIGFIEDHIDNIRVNDFTDPDVTKNGVLRDCILLISDNLRDEHGIDLYVDDSELTANFYDAGFIVDLYLNFRPDQLFEGILKDGELAKLIRGMIDEDLDNVLLSILEYHSTRCGPGDTYSTDRFVWLQDKVRSNEGYNAAVRYYMENDVTIAVDAGKYLELSKALNNQLDGLRLVIAEMSSNPDYHISTIEYNMLKDFFRIDLKRSERLPIALRLHGDQRMRFLSKIGITHIDKEISDYRIVVEAIRVVSNYRLFGIVIKDNPILADIPIYQDAKNLLLNHLPKVTNANDPGSTPEEPEFIVEP